MANPRRLPPVADIIVKYPKGAEETVSLSLPSLPDAGEKDYTVTFTIDSDKMSARVVVTPGVISK